MENLQSEASKEFEQTISDIAKKHLPAAIGEELQQVLAKGKQDAQLVEASNKRVELQAEKLLEQEREIKKLSDYLGRHGEITKREKVVQAREDKLAIEAAETRAKHAEDTLSKITQLTEIVFRNPTKVLNINRSKSIPVKDQYGNSQMQFGSETEHHTASED